MNSNNIKSAKELPFIKPSSSHYYVVPSTWPTLQTTSNEYISEKSRIRKISHSAIEKKRREKMNDKIEKLKTLIPACTPQFPIAIQQPIQKLSVLQAAIDYIQELHGQLTNNLPPNHPILKDLGLIQNENNNDNKKESINTN